MRPTEIPDAEVWPGARRVMFGAPPDMPDVESVPALVDRGEDTGEVRALVRLELEPGDLEKLAAGGTVWLGFYGAMVPWCVDVKGPGE
ncbi:hypothetical protein GCM10018962_77230 [Dactylosporangium matsuzakiense]|uniref:hypothetical protein n=1 Tax=Dactylosporangium matsuzakiense TaxID=53360 RepID=UPI0031F16AD0